MTYSRRTTSYKKTASTSARASYRRSYYKVNSARYAGRRTGITNKYGK